jgi:hypothetical protein
MTAGGVSLHRSYSNDGSGVVIASSGRDIAELGNGELPHLHIATLSIDISSYRHIATFSIGILSYCHIAIFSIGILSYRHIATLSTSANHILSIC